MKTFTLSEFMKRFPDDNSCLETLKNLWYPDGIVCKRCKVVQKFYRLKDRPAYTCAICSYHFYPLAQKDSAKKDCILRKSSTPLKLWFYSIFIMTQTRSGVSAKTLQREIGCTYKTAWRMMKKIREKMDENLPPLDKTVESDESFFGGLGKNRKYVPHFNEKPKDIIMGFVQREDGKAVMKKIETTGKYALLEQIQKHVDPKAKIVTDEFPGYTQLGKLGYDHHVVNHGKTFVKDKITHTQNIEGLWGRIKPAVKGVYRKVSSKYLESYMNEYCFRYNHRKTPEQMFDLLLARIVSV